MFFSHFGKAMLKNAVFYNGFWTFLLQWYLSLLGSFHRASFSYGFSYVSATLGHLTSNLSPTCLQDAILMEKLPPRRPLFLWFFLCLGYFGPSYFQLIPNLPPRCHLVGQVASKLPPRWLQVASKTSTWAQLGPTWLILGSSSLPLASKNQHFV